MQSTLPAKIDRTSEITATDYTDVVSKLRERYSSSPLRYGYIGYEPFVLVENGNHSGPIVRLIKQLCAALQIDCEGMRISWNTITDALENHLVDIVLDPVVEGRPVAIVAYAKTHTPLLVCNREVVEEVSTCLDIFWKAARTAEFSEQKALAMIKAVHLLERLRHGIGVTRGTIERKIIEDVLKVHPAKLYEGSDLSENIKLGLADNFIMVADEPSFRKIEKDLPGRPMSIPIFPDGFQSTWIPTGFAVRRVDFHLQTFLAKESEFSQQQCIRKAMRELETDELVIRSRMKFLSNGGALPVFPVPTVLDQIFFEMAQTSGRAESNLQLGVNRAIEELTNENEELRLALSEKHSAKELLFVCASASIALLANLVVWFDFGVIIVHPLLAALGLLGTLSFMLLAIWRLRINEGSN